MDSNSWADTICGACQLMDAWKNIDPEIWSAWDQQIRDELTEILKELYAAEK